MIKSTIKLLFGGFTYVQSHPQLLMTVVLIMVIPIAFLVSSQQFLGISRDNHERLEKDRIGIAQDIFSSYIIESEFDINKIQKEIESIASLNSDIVEIMLAHEEGEGLRILASKDTSFIQTIVRDPQVFRNANVNPEQSLTTPFASNGVRYWHSVRLVKNGENDRYYIYFETSLESIDKTFARKIKTAYAWLALILTIVLVLVIRHVRLIDYAYLYSETKKANEMKDLFTNMIAHELRAPLTAMRGYASLIRESEVTDITVKSQAGKIEDSAERLVLIVNDLLDVARIHSGKLLVTNANVNIQTVVASVLDAMQAIAKEKNISLTQEGILSPLMLNIDEKRLYQALTNLVSNSLKYTPSGSITVSLDDRTDRVEIRVKDTGTGISADNQKNLFAPFFRVNSVEVDQTVGTGLGMWITKQLIELMKGSIGVESIKGVGTHIVVTLPK